MSQENVEIVRSICAAWERGDFRSVEWAHPDIDYAIVGGPAPGTWKGMVGMAEATRDALSPWQDFHIEVEEYRELDGERVLVLWNSKGRGKASGLETGQLHPTGAYLFQTRGDRVIRLAYYVDRAEALEAVGLPEHNDRLTAVPVGDKIRILNAGVEALNAREVNEALLTDDFEIVNVSNAVTDKTYRGASGAREWIHDFFDVLDENARFEITEIVEAGEDYLVVHNRLAGTGSASGVPFDMEWFSAWWFRDGRMARGVGYGSRRAALAAVHGDAHADS